MKTVTVKAEEKGSADDSDNNSYISLYPVKKKKKKDNLMAVYVTYRENIHKYSIKCTSTMHFRNNTPAFPKHLH